MKTAQNIFFYAAAFCTVSFFFGMEVSSNITNEYTKIVKPLENVNIEKNDLRTSYHSLETLVNSCPTKAEKTMLLDLPLNNKEKKLIHYIASLSHRKDIDLLKFWDLLFNNNVTLNTQDTDGNTPLLDAFYIHTDETTGKKSILWDPETIFHLLSNEANPVLENNRGESPKSTLELETSKEAWLTSSLNRAYAAFFSSRCYLYSYK